MATLNTSDKKLWGRHPTERQQVVLSLLQTFGTVVTRKQVLDHVVTIGKEYNDVTWLLNNRLFRLGRGRYTLQPLLMADAQMSAN
jgi:hypothetical protein